MAIKDKEKDLNRELTPAEKANVEYKTNIDFIKNRIDELESILNVPDQVPVVENSTPQNLSNIVNDAATTQLENLENKNNSI